MDRARDSDRDRVRGGGGGERRSRGYSTSRGRSSCSHDYMGNGQQTRSQIWKKKSLGAVSEKSEQEATSSSHFGAPELAKLLSEMDTSYTAQCNPTSACMDTCSSTESCSKNRHFAGKRDQTNGKTTADGACNLYESSHAVIISCPQDVSRGELKSNPNSMKFDSPPNTIDNKNTEPFDICLKKIGTPIVLKSSLLDKNREKRKENMHSGMEKEKVLRSGMVLLKHFLSCADQVKIVKKCRELGLGSGGFYQPGYTDGAQLRLKMMCLGKNWDPETSRYENHRSTDGAIPPIIPEEFHEHVKRAIQVSHATIRKDDKRSRVEGILPFMSADICIVNFYSATGRLGLHKDRDESQESLAKGIPVVSFSIGDSAEFLYGDVNDIEKAQKIVLESGDVLIFGGKSRHVFHGVKSIIPNTAPNALLEETNLRPGRLNLTFRQY